MRKPYHHDDLRNELVEAALAHVSAHGHGDLSIRKLAQIVGVSSGAPYHHFPDRRAVLIAVAERAFQLLRADIQRRAGDAETPRAYLEAASHAFFDFAETQANLFELMYDSELTRPLLDPKIEDQYHQIYLVIKDNFLNIGVDFKEIEIRTRIYWSTIFGFAFLSTYNKRGYNFSNVNNGKNIRKRIIDTAIGI